MPRAFDAIRFITQHGVVLASAKGPIPNVADAVGGEPIRGSWWGHAKGSEIFRALNELGDSPDVQCFRWIDGKITFAHRTVWPALVRLADEIGRSKLTAIKQEHTATGAHRNVRTVFPKWVPSDVMRAASRLSDSDARRQLPDWLTETRLTSVPRRKP